MIVKEIKSSNATRSVQGLVKYMLDTEHDGEKVDFSNITNCYSDDVSLATVEINLVQDKNTRTKLDKTMHLVISFPENEIPTQEQLDDIEQSVADAIGLGNHQRISVAHSNTGNYHLHMAINKIDPVSYKMVNPYGNFREMSKVRDALEIKHNLQRTERSVDGPRNDTRIDHHSGEQSLATWSHEHIKPELDKAIKDATSWADIHAVFSDAGLTLNKSGRGLAVHDAKSDTTIKASTVSRNLSLTRLEKTLGKFTPVRQKKTRESSYSREKTNNSLYQQYEAFREDRLQSKNDDLARLKHTAEKQRTQAKKDNQFKRQAIKNSFRTPAQKRTIYKRLAENNRRHLADITKGYAEARKKAYAQHGNMTFQQYLCHEAANGNEEALAKLRQNAQKVIKHQGISGEGDKRITQFDAVSVDKHGVISYKVGKHTIEDNGKSLACNDDSLTADKQLLEMAVAKYGRNLTLNGSEEFKARLQSAAELLNMDVVLNGHAVGEKDPVQQFIANRNLDRTRNRNIACHERFAGQKGAFSYQGYRNVGQQSVVLLKQGHTLYVREVPKKDLAQYKSLKVGAIIETGSLQQDNTERGAERD
ncbi:TraI/MobA(P) family conjugative relaxase [Scandinavium goeteborgense]|uniref:TraI/MobA(P) family conjugative relaxase n=1 Tax=Scandinavium goeteborgense TaxID=1851514 RepID=UPI003808FDDE